MSGVGAFTLVAVGTGINTAATIAKGRDPFPTLMAGTVLGTICVGLDSATGSNIGTAFGALFLLGSFLTNGVNTIDTVTSLIESKR